MTKEEREKLIIDNRLLVYKIINTHFADKLIFPLEYGDLVGAGSIGLIEAIDKYKPDMKVPQSSWIAMNIYWRVDDELIHAGWVDSHVFRHVRGIIKTYGDITDLSADDVITISNETGKTEGEINELISIFRSGIISCTENMIEILDGLDYCTIDYIEQYILAHRLLDQLSQSEFYLIKSIFFDGKTFSDLTRETGLPSNVISKEVKNILTKMREFQIDD